MAPHRRTTSAASRVAAACLIAVLTVGAVVLAVLVWEAQRSVRSAAEQVTRAVAETLADSDDVRQGLRLADTVPDDAHTVLQPLAELVAEDTAVDFVTIMTAEGVRITHPDPARVGERYLGTVPDEPRTFTEQWTGTLGPSVRTIVPVHDGAAVAGWVAVGVTVQNISDDVLLRLPLAIGLAVALVAMGLALAVLAGRLTRRVTGDLAPGSVRDAVSSYESIRTLGEALRAQTHEHGNRMHTAVALIELGRSDEAVRILTETSRQSQLLVDQVAARRDGDPTVGALLLGKAAQARERGIAWRADIAPDAPRSVLSPVDAVSVLGNLIDNALDAATEAPEPRWVHVTLCRVAAGLRVSVADSGSGIPPGLERRVFDHGFSTKPAGPAGRGVGLALARSVVEHAGGTLVHHGDPTTFVVDLPESAS